MKTLTKFAIGLTAAVTIGTAAMAKPPLRDVAEIDDHLFWGVLAYEVSEQCNTLEARKLKAINELWALGRKAEALGFSRDEIKSYIRSDEEKARMRTRGETFLTSKGVDMSDPKSFCTFGHAEIERNSAIGVYLRAK
ncbi:MAG: DUF5333 domain-containing protein [Shimia sp.]|jgi:hypothetical protein|uniref:DUF5333 domain-containing protein n=1 Tax=Shimia sp. TaxID=1954381 RepID=UPI004057F3D2